MSRSVVLCLLIALLALAAAGLGNGQSAATYAGVSNCKMCHGDKHEAWLKTKHARAFKLLEMAGKTSDPKCLACHVTGYGDGGYQIPAEGEKPNPDFAAITCEACHGKGSEHNGDKEKIVRVPPATVCIKCHSEASHPEEGAG